MNFASIRQTISIFIKSPGKFRIVRKGISALVKEGIPGLKKGIKGKIDFYERLSSVHTDEAKVQQFFYSQQNQFSKNSMGEMETHFKDSPLISIIMPTYNTSERCLRLAIESVIRQIYENWELCIVDNGSSKSEVYNVLESYSKKDPTRIKVKFLSINTGISTASNIALEMASGSYVALLDHDDELTPDALFWVVKEINDFPESDFIYSDECKIDNTEERKLFHFFFKPEWSPELLLNGMYTGHLTVYRTSVINEAGAFRSKYDFSQDYDLALRISEKAKTIRHIERILYLWRSVPGSAAQDGKPWARISNLDALKDTMKRRNIDSYILPYPYTNRVKIRRATNAKVSIIIPSDSLRNLYDSINSLLAKTAYVNYEIVIVTNSVLIEKLKEQWRPFQHIIFVPYNKNFNFSDKCNEGAKHAFGKILVFLNDDVFPRDESWIENLIEYLYLQDIGAVSPKLIYEDGIIQYAGMFVGAPGFVGTAYSGYYENEVDEFNTLHRWVRDVSILSGACFAIKKSIFDELGGFDPDNTPNGHSDVDLSFRVREKGLRIVYTPYVILIHKGNHSWHEADKCTRPDIYLMKRWADYLISDPYFTNSMKKFIYRDFPYEFKFFGKRIKEKSKRNILLVSHEMSETGAPLVLLYLARIIRGNGDYPVFVSPIDGVMRRNLYNEGFHVIINQNIYGNDLLFKKFAENFDLIIANTLLSLPVVRQLSGMRIVWWLHEGEFALNNYVEINKNVISDMKNLGNNSNLQILCVSEYSKEIFTKRVGFNCDQIFAFGIPDRRPDLRKKQHSDIRFIMAGSIEKRKGQDIFVTAIAQIPVVIRRNARFVIIGNSLDAQYYQDLIVKTADIDEIVVENALPHLKLMKEFEDSDVIICPSRDEPFSITLLEGMMLSKACICSNKTGIANYIKSEDCGWVFDVNTPEELTEIMNNIIMGKENLEEKGKNGRKVYEENFTMECFKKRALKQLSAVEDHNNSVQPENKLSLDCLGE
ncbi:conserved hypothetical protein [uncultured spirochete]|uniref:Glycosyltransferase n=1 Tax=uncultured spirochete TaxID=156406 RepID=A0A3P3XSI7_9SPIR|nr:conserved hypothetical protein [uncultured spirochete]